MLQGKELILATKKYVKENRLKSWWLLFSSVFLLGLGYLGALINFHWTLQLLSAIFTGLIVARVFIIYHDYLHKTILQESLLAKVIFTVFGMFILAPTSIWKRSHDYHHNHNCKLHSASIGSFPLLTKKQFLTSSLKEKRHYLFIRHPLTIGFGYVFAFLWGMSLKSLVNSSGKHWDSFFALVFHFGISVFVFIYLGPQAYLLGVLLPFVIYGGLGSYLFYAQHNYPDAKYKNKESWTYVHSALNSSSFMDLSPVLHWFTGNIGYHHIHHVNARIPFYNLPKVYKEMEEFQNPGTTTLSPKDMYKCLRLKLWDAEKNKMIGLDEL
ncbi:MAG: omega-6 fatty acid desaturase (delta-12 desaturase) [Glaciecola sp.]|jgi:omega-6 fatty acid desaturase (delta-12 desaturase)